MPWARTALLIGCTLQTLYATEKALAHTPELEAFAGKTVLVTEPSGREW